MDLPLWPSKRSLQQVGIAIASYGTNPSLENTPILGQLIPDTRRDLRPVWETTFRTVPLSIEDFSGNFPGAEREAGVYFQTNELRDLIPNFTMGLTVAPCEDKHWIYPPCPGTNGGPMLITEFIPGPTLLQFINAGLQNPQILFKQVLSLFIQMVQALEVANQRLNFVHGNLVSRTVIVRPLGRPILIKYPNMTIETAYYPVGVDFEQATLDPDIDPRWDIYSLLVTTFIFFPNQFAQLLAWYGVGWNPSQQYPEVWWYQNMPSRMRKRSVSELIGFAMEAFGFQMLSGQIQETLVPSDIRGYEPPLIASESLAGLADIAKAARTSRYGKKK
jgi:hypothetical protein